MLSVCFKDETAFLGRFFFLESLPYDDLECFRNAFTVIHFRPHFLDYYKPKFTFCWRTNIRVRFIHGWECNYSFTKYCKRRENSSCYHPSTFIGNLCTLWSVYRIYVIFYSTEIVSHQITVFLLFKQYLSIVVIC